MGRGNEVEMGSDVMVGDVVRWQWFWGDGEVRWLWEGEVEIGSNLVAGG